MSLNAATIEALIAKGLDAQDILDVARATEVKSDPTNAARQARHRAKKRNAVTVTVNGSPHEEISIPPSETPVVSDETTPPVQILKPEHVLEAFNVMADRTGLPKAKLTDERRKKLRTFVRRHPIDDITEAISAIERSSFCRGENDRGWRADFDFLLQPKSFTRLIEGTYDR